MRLREKQASKQKTNKILHTDKQLQSWIVVAKILGRERRLQWSKKEIRFGELGILFCFEMKTIKYPKFN
jgi:hypothetical protein